MYKVSLCNMEMFSVTIFLYLEVEQEYVWRCWDLELVSKRWRIKRLNKNQANIGTYFIELLS